MDMKIIAGKADSRKNFIDGDRYITRQQKLFHPNPSLPRNPTSILTAKQPT